MVQLSTLNSTLTPPHPRPGVVRKLLNYLDPSEYSLKSIQAMSACLASENELKTVCGPRFVQLGPDQKNFRDIFWTLLDPMLGGFEALQSIMELQEAPRKGWDGQKFQEGTIQTCPA